MKLCLTKLYVSYIEHFTFVTFFITVAIIVCYLGVYIRMRVV